MPSATVRGEAVALRWLAPPTLSVGKPPVRHGAMPKSLRNSRVTQARLRISRSNGANRAGHSHDKPTVCRFADILLSAFCSGGCSTSLVRSRPRLIGRERDQGLPQEGIFQLVVPTSPARAAL